MNTSTALAIDKSFNPVPEWTTPKAAIMGGISDCEKVAPYYAEYLAYMAELSLVVPAMNTRETFG